MTGAFAEGFASWRRVLAGGGTASAQMVRFVNCASEVAGYVAHGLPRAEAADALTELACAHGLELAFGADEVQRVISEAFDNVEVVPDLLDRSLDSRTNGKNAPFEAIDVVNPFPIDGAALPRRAWLIPGLLLRRQVTLIVAPPGSGKSLLTLQLAMVCASGVGEWAGWRPRGCFRSLVINVEEDETEMRRRLFGASLKMGITQENLTGILLAQASSTNSIVIARADNRNKTVTATPMLERIVQTILACKIDLVIVDPFAETFAGDENSNSELKWAGVLWREVARRTNVAVLLVHHAKKYAQHMAGDMDAGRGGGALPGVARIVSTLFTMTEEEYETFREAIKKQFPKVDRTRFIRFDDAKANLSVVSTSARWFCKETIGIGNAGDGLPEDEVGVLVPWVPPDPFSNMDVPKANAILDEIAVGIRNDDGEPTGDRYAPTKKGGSKRWVGQLIQRELACSEPHAKAVIEAWLETGVLVEYQAPTSSSKGNNRECLKVNDGKRPGTVTDAAFL